MKNQISNSFPENFMEGVYVCGFLYRSVNKEIELLLKKDDQNHRVIGGTLRLNDMFFDQSRYLRELEKLFYSLVTSANEPMYHYEHISELIEEERFKDSERGSVAPYFRALIYFFLKKTGIYVHQYQFIAWVNQQPIAKMAFVVHSFKFPQQGKIHTFSGNTCQQYIGNRKLHHDIIFVDTIEKLYKGRNGSYAKLFESVQLSIKKPS